MMGMIKKIKKYWGNFLIGTFGVPPSVIWESCYLEFKEELDNMVMTEKRFTYDSKTVSVLKDGEFWLDGNIDTACNHSEICKELNELHEENQALKLRLEFIEAHNKALIHTNDELKKDLRKYDKLLELEYWREK